MDQRKWHFSLEFIQFPVDTQFFFFASFNWVDNSIYICTLNDFSANLKINTQKK